MDSNSFRNKRVLQISQLKIVKAGMYPSLALRDFRKKPFRTSEKSLEVVFVRVVEERRPDEQVVAAELHRKLGQGI